jgi:CRP/FNR family transcriptional regulator
MQTLVPHRNTSTGRPQPTLARSDIPVARRTADREFATGRRISDTLGMLADQLAPVRRIVHTGDVIYRAGECFSNLYVLNSGMCKTVNLAADGREQLVSLAFRGDWLGFDGIAVGRYCSDAIAMDTGEVWVVPYHALLEISRTSQTVLHALHAAMSQAIARDRDSLMSVCTLPAIARVADFLLNWADSLAERGIRTDEFTLRMTRAEIGNHLGMTLESVSRALSRLARDHIIEFATQGRREVRIPDVDALSAFVQRHLAAASCALH